MDLQYTCPAVGAAPQGVAKDQDHSCGVGNNSSKHRLARFLLEGRQGKTSILAQQLCCSEALTSDSGSSASDLGSTGGMSTGGTAGAAAAAVSKLSHQQPSMSDPTSRPRRSSRLRTAGAPRGDARVYAGDAHTTAAGLVLAPSRNDYDTDNDTASQTSCMLSHAFQASEPDLVTAAPQPSHLQRSSSSTGRGSAVRRSSGGDASAAPALAVSGETQRARRTTALASAGNSTRQVGSKHRLAAQQRGASRLAGVKRADHTSDAEGSAAAACGAASPAPAAAAAAGDEAACSAASKRHRHSERDGTLAPNMWPQQRTALPLGSDCRPDAGKNAAGDQLQPATPHHARKTHAAPQLQHAASAPPASGVAPCYEYIMGTNVPIDGWFQPCRGCNDKTGRTHAIGAHDVPLCGACAAKMLCMASGSLPSEARCAPGEEPLSAWVPALVPRGTPRFSSDQRVLFCHWMLLRQHETWRALAEASRASHARAAAARAAAAAASNAATAAPSALLSG